MRAIGGSLIIDPLTTKGLNNVRADVAKESPCSLQHGIRAFQNLFGASLGTAYQEIIGSWGERGNDRSPFELSFLENGTIDRIQTPPQECRRLKSAAFLEPSIPPVTGTSLSPL